MKTVIVESPYAGKDAIEVLENTIYAREAMADCLARGEAPFASHLLYTQAGVLDDKDPRERALGIEAGLAIGDRLDATAVYADRGISPGMLQGLYAALDAGRPVEVRFLYLDTQPSLE